MGGYFVGGHPGQPFRIVQPADWVAHQPVPESRQARYAMGYFGQDGNGKTFYFLDMSTGKWHPVSALPEQTFTQWFGIGASARIQGDLLSESEEARPGSHALLRVKSIVPSDRMMTPKPAAAPTDPPVFEGVLAYSEQRQVWMLVEKETQNVFDLSELDDAKIGKWFASYQWVRVRVQDDPQPQTTLLPDDPARQLQENTAGSIRILSLEPI